jgi:hypothetical protein
MTTWMAEEEVSQNEDGRKARISERLEDQPKIGPSYNAGHNVRAWLNRKQERGIAKGQSYERENP